MAGPGDWLGAVEKVDSILQRFLQLRKCKFCGTTMSERAVFCDGCGKSQV
ncbi:MAG: hypothetical protein WCC94_01465 [Candidatus Bathyarchaeia archaeon]